MSNFLESNSLLPPFQFSYRRGLETCDALLTLSHRLQVALNRGIERRLVQLDFSAAFDKIGHCDSLYKLRSIGIGGQFLSIVSELLSARKQSVRLDCKVNASVDLVSRMAQG